MNICPSCANEVLDQPFCGRCGTRLIDDDAAIEAEARRAVEQLARAGEDEETKRVIKRALGRADTLNGFAWIFAILAVLNLVAFIVYLFVGSDDDTNNHLFAEPLAGVALGAAFTLGVIAAVLFGLVSLIEVSARRLALLWADS